MKTKIHFLSYLAHFFLEWEMFQTKIVEKIKTHILCSATIFLKSYRLWDNVAKYCRAGQAIDENMVHAHCMLDTKDYKHTYLGYVTLTVFHCKNGWKNAPQMLCYTYIACLV